MTGIYKITINNKIYVGSSFRLKQRLIQHKTDLKGNRHDNYLLQKAYNIFKTFETEIIEILPDSIPDKELRSIEAKYIKELHAEYNIQDPEEHFPIKKVYQFDLSGTFIKEYKSVSEASEITGFSISNIQHAAQPNEKLTRTAGGFYWQYEPEFREREADKRLTKIYVYTLSGKFLKEFENVKSCCQTLFPDKKYASSVINRICRNKTASFQGYRFSYEKVEHLDNSKLSGIAKNVPILQVSLDKKKVIRIAENMVKMAKEIGYEQPNISQSILHGRPYRGYYFLRLGTESRELLETLENAKTETELETVDGKV